MKSVLLVTLSWHTDHQEAIFSMYTQMKAQGVKVWTLTIADSDYPAPHNEDNYFVRAPKKPGIETETFNFSEMLRMMKIVRKLNFDILYFESFHIWNYPLMMYCKSKRKVLTHIIHDAVIHEGDSNVKIKTLLNKTIIDLSDIILTKSKLGADTIKKMYPKRANKVRCVSVWREFSGYAQPSGEKVLFFGRLNIYKGIDDLYQVIRSTPNIGFIVKGKPDRAAVEVVQKINELPNAILDGNTVPYAKLDELFRNSKCVILPYQSATQSGVVIDAYKHSCPVIAFDVGALGEQVLDGKTGYLVSAGDVEGLIRCLHRIFSMNESEYSKMCHDAYQYGYSCFSAQSQVDDFMDAIGVR